MFLQKSNEIETETVKKSSKVASSGENTNAAPATTPTPTTSVTTNRIALTTLDNAIAQATSGGGAVLVAEIQISPVGTSGSGNTTIIKTATNPPGTTTVQALAQQMRLSPLQSHATNSTGGRDITSSGSGVMTGNCTDA